jgi:hypothetical protein
MSRLIVKLKVEGSGFWDATSPHVKRQCNVSFNQYTALRLFGWPFALLVALFDPEILQQEKLNFKGMPGTPFLVPDRAMKICRGLETSSRDTMCSWRS